MLSAEERAELARWVGGAVSARVAERARIILACAEGASNTGVAADFGVSTETVRKWRSRFVARRVAGLVDEPRPGRRKPELVLSEAERAELTRWARRVKTAQFLALRAKIVLRCAEGGTNKEIASELGVSHGTVNRWRSRFIRLRLDGLTDEPRPGRPPSILLDQVEDVLTATLESTPGKDTQNQLVRHVQASDTPAEAGPRLRVTPPFTWESSPESSMTWTPTPALVRSAITFAASSASG
ncbi:helix-turn-helix domain-containing protein [Streptomyces chryseus]